ncbi:DsbA family oxidoreductase [Azoarcus sp. KH32C]|uniref:DsbA family oxidoreductase n=1 Tax=Azoarcus sp. KH32C TaxID=748247 RepID=UPI00023867E1|nr:DsbA family oxidoreductase [Azoarcus sp. KH32C]BAL22635.1 hypothetical protein AZKH_0289 [Azoarcus sp. KH32C]
MILNIDLVSDFVCPWCLLGKARLARAIEQVRATHPELELRINWLPYFLNPDLPAAGAAFRPWLDAKFGSASAVDDMHARLTEAGAADGVSFDFERIARLPNTLNAHRLTYRAQSQGQTQARVNQLAQALFAAHFQEGRDIGDIATLADIAVDCGEDRTEIESYLASNEDAATVKRLAGGVRKQGVEGVPFFIMNRCIGVSGAQQPAALGAAILQSLRPH